MKNILQPGSSIAFIIAEMDRDDAKTRIYTVEELNKRVQVRIESA